DRDPASGADHGLRGNPGPALGQAAVGAQRPYARWRLRARSGDRRPPQGAGQAGDQHRGGCPVPMVSGRRSRLGSGARGCLISLALFTAALYYGINIGEVYLRYYRVLDAMRFQASIAPSV